MLLCVIAVVVVLAYLFLIFLLFGKNVFVRTPWPQDRLEQYCCTAASDNHHNKHHVYGRMSEKGSTETHSSGLRWERRVVIALVLTAVINSRSSEMPCSGT